LELNTNMLSEERQREVLRRAKIEFCGIAIDKHNLFIKMVRKALFRKLLKSKTLLEFMVERKRLHEEGVYYGTLEEEMTVPYIGLTKKELYSMGLDKERVDICSKLNYEEVFMLSSILGKKKYEEVHAYRT